MPRYARLFRALLKLFPADFRGDFGDAMAADFHDQRRDAEGRPREVRRLWLRTAFDLLRRAPAEHLDVLARDAGYALRALRRHPLASIAAIVSLAIGIGLNSAVFSVVSGVLWRSLPFAESGRLVLVEALRTTNQERAPLTAATFLDIQRQSQTLDRVAAGVLQVLTIVDREPFQVGCVSVSEQFFEVLGVTPTLGRPFTRAHYDAARAQRGNPDAPAPMPAAVLLSDRLWRRLGGSSDIVGTEIRMAGGVRAEVVGVMGPELEALDRVMPGQCWSPDVPNPAQGAWRPSIVLARLAPEQSLKDANAELAVIGNRVSAGLPANEPQTLQAQGLLDSIVDRVRTQLMFLFGAVVCVLLVTSANVVNLFLARAAGRRNELTTRIALGASRLRLVRQSLTESLVISLLGGIGGFLLALWGVPILVSLAPPTVPRLPQIGVSWGTLAFTFLLSGTVGLSCGLVTVLSMRHGHHTSFASSHDTPPAARLRHGVTVCAIAIALMLAVAATLMVRTVRALTALDLGFDPRSVVSATLSSSPGERRAAQDYHTAIIERVKALPGVRAAGIGLGPLLGGMGIGGLIIPGDSRDFGLVRVDAVSPGYFEALGVRLLSGRFFAERDAVRGGPSLIIVNESAARLFWNSSDPIGKTVMINKRQELEVIGVIGDLRGSSLEQEQGPTIYQLSNQSANFMANGMLIRVDGDPGDVVPGIRAIIRSMNREQPFTGVTPLQERIDRSMAPRLFVLRVIGLFSAIGLVLAVVGVYGVLAEFVVQRVPEIGVRMAFGATASDVLALVLRQGVRLIAIGLALGLAGAVLLRRVMSTMVYGVQTFDPASYLTAGLVLCAVALLACAIPARKASRLDPSLALRSE